MKKFRQNFRRIVLALQERNAVKRLTNEEFDKTQKAWKKIAAELRPLISSWKDKDFPDWIYPEGKQIKPEDSKEVVIAIRLINELEEYEDNHVWYNKEQIIKALDKEAEYAKKNGKIDSVAMGMADIIYEDEKICEIPTEDFLWIFVL